MSPTVSDCPGVKIKQTTSVNLAVYSPSTTCCCWVVGRSYCCRVVNFTVSTLTLSHTGRGWRRKTEKVRKKKKPNERNSLHRQSWSEVKRRQWSYKRWRNRKVGKRATHKLEQRWKMDRTPPGLPWGLCFPLLPFLTPNSGARWGSADGRVSPPHTQTPKAVSTKTHKRDNQIMGLQRS